MIVKNTICPAFEENSVKMLNAQTETLFPNELLTGK